MHQISERYSQVQKRITKACHRAGRDVREITLIAVTKTWPPEIVEAALEVGLMDFGENKVQELVAKAPLFPKVNWYMIGHLQRNKARQVVAHAREFHALDSLRLARALNRHAEQAARVLPCFVQVNVSGEDSKFGLRPPLVDELVAQLNDLEYLRLTGLMTLASPDARKVRDEFRLLRSIQSRYVHLGCQHLSMGMSGDYEVAIEEGATHVRIGSALFGPRR